MPESASGTIIGWRVEARCTLDEPKVYNGVLLGGKWTRLSFPDAPLGVPKGPRFNMPWLSYAGCFSYEAAQALRWWWLAELGVLGALCVETRLTRHSIAYEFKTESAGDGHIENEDSTRWVNTEDLP